MSLSVVAVVEHILTVVPLVVAVEPVVLQEMIHTFHQHIEKEHLQSQQDQLHTPLQLVEVVWVGIIRVTHLLILVCQEQMEILVH
tara:strand:+ start:78 stop:332 length:255 start_codon:yes stop_codon:yes gene_type:complete